MNALPCEMIEYIYSYLPYSDLVCATEVCRRWNEIFEPRMVARSVLHINGNTIVARNDAFANVAQRIVQSVRMYTSVTLKAIDFDCLARSEMLQLTVFLANQGANIVELLLKDCNISLHKLYHILHLTNQAYTLSVASCYIHESQEFQQSLFIASALKHLKKINFSNVRTESNCVFELMLRDNQATLELTMTKENIDNNTQLIIDHADRITALSCLFYRSNTLYRIFDGTKLNLRALRLHRQPWDELHDTVISETILRQILLQELHLNTAISISILCEIAQTMEYLQSLSVSISNNKDPMLFDIYWPSLKSLDIISAEHMTELMSGMSFASLEELRLRTNHLSKRTIICIYEKCRRLKKLGLSALSMLQCDGTLGAISVNLPNLERLEFHCTGRTTFIPMLKSIASLKRLSSITFVSCEKISDETIQLLKTPYLHTFSVIGNRNITREGLRSLFTNCPQIKCLTLSQCGAIDDLAVETTVNCLPYLEFLDISKSPAITLNSIRHIITSLPHLKCVRLEECPQILAQWRTAQQYIGNITTLRNYYHNFPGFFSYNLPLQHVIKYDSDDYYIYDDTDSDEDLMI